MNYQCRMIVLSDSCQTLYLSLNESYEEQDTTMTQFPPWAGFPFRTNPGRFREDDSRTRFSRHAERNFQMVYFAIQENCRKEIQSLCVAESIGKYMYIIMDMCDCNNNSNDYFYTYDTMT